MLECKDCCLYNTDACRYGRYALEHNMSLNCDDFIVEHNKAYQQGRAEGRIEVIDEFVDKVSESIIWDILAEVMKRNIGASEGADRIIEYLQKIAKELKEQNSNKLDK